MGATLEEPAIFSNRRNLRDFRAGSVVLALLTATSSAASPPNLAIVNVAVIDVDAGILEPGQTVLVEGEWISRVAPNGSVTTPPGAKTIDGSGLFLMPGLIDAHVHYISPETFGPMLLAHGVVLVRDMGGPTKSVLALREKLRAGKLIGPEMLCTGAILDGDPPVWGFSEVCRDAEEARAAVRKLASAGVDQIKLYDRLSKKAYHAAVREAHRLGLKVAGHVPMVISLSDAIDAGQDCIEHLDGMPRLIATATQHEPDSLSSLAAWSLYANADQNRLRETYRRMRDQGTTICPTLVVTQGIGRAATPQANDKRLAYVPEMMRSFWSNDGFRQSAPLARQVVPFMQSVVHDLHEEGVNLICGTDLANPYVFAGSSLHEEMELWQAAGIPTNDVLRSATVRSSEFLGVEDRLGTIEEGKVASMILTKANPLEDVRNADEIVAVFLRGRCFDRARLDHLLDEARAHAKRTYRDE